MTAIFAALTAALTHGPAVIALVLTVGLAAVGVTRPKPAPACLNCRGPIPAGWDTDTCSWTCHHAYSDYLNSAEGVWH